MVWSSFATFFFCHILKFIFIKSNNSKLEKRKNNFFLNVGVLGFWGFEWHSPGKAASHHQRLVCRNHAGARRRTNKFSWFSKPRYLPVGMSEFYSLRIRGGRRQMQPRNNRARKSIDLARPIGKRLASSKRRKGRGSFSATAVQELRDSRDTVTGGEGLRGR